MPTQRVGYPLAVERKPEREEVATMQHEAAHASQRLAFSTHCVASTDAQHRVSVLYRVLSAAWLVSRAEVQARGHERLKVVFHMSLQLQAPRQYKLTLSRSDAFGI